MCSLRAVSCVEDTRHVNPGRALPSFSLVASLDHSPTKHGREKQTPAPAGEAPREGLTSLQKARVLFHSVCVPYVRENSKTRTASAPLKAFKKTEMIKHSNKPPHGQTNKQETLFGRVSL